jgi:hypothetical protein
MVRVISRTSPSGFFRGARRRNSFNAVRLTARRTSFLLHLSNLCDLFRDIHHLNRGQEFFQYAGHRSSFISRDLARDNGRREMRHCFRHVRNSAHLGKVWDLDVARATRWASSIQDRADHHPVATLGKIHGDRNNVGNLTLEEFIDKLALTLTQSGRRWRRKNWFVRTARRGRQRRQHLRSLDLRNIAGE